MVHETVVAITDMVALTRAQPGSVLTIRVGLFGKGGEFVNGYQYEHMSLVSKLRACLQKTCAERSNWKHEPDVLLMRSDYTDQVRSTTTVLQNTKTPVVTKRTRLRHIGMSTNRQYDLLATLTHETVLTAEQNKELFRIISIKEPRSVRFIQKVVFIEHVTHADYVITLRYDIAKISPKGATKMASTGQACSYECAVTFADVVESNSHTTQKDPALNQIVAQLLLSRAVSLLGSYRNDRGALVKLEDIKLEITK